VLGHHAVRRDGQAVLARPRELLLPDVLPRELVAARGDPEMQAPVGIGELLVAQAQDVLEVERLVALHE
jgi:hypothetical protein